MPRPFQGWGKDKRLGLNTKMYAISRKNLWERTPRGIKTGLRRLLDVMPPGYLLGRSFRKHLAFVGQAQQWPADRSRQYQLAQLRRVCTIAAERSSFYRRLFDEVDFDPRALRRDEDLSALPIIDKETIRDNLSEMLTVSRKSSFVDYVSTGGSCGVPMGFYIGADRSAIEYAYLVASWQRAGYRLDIPQAVFRGQPVEPDATGLRHEYDPALRRHVYSNFHMTDENMGRYLRHVATIGPCYLHVYPSSIATLTRYVHRTGAALPENIRGILAGSEIVLDADRAATEAATGLRYFSWYGHTEKLVLAAECERSGDYHVWPTYGYMELVDEHDRPITTPGQRGEIVGTGFINTVVPFIRYRTGDFATLAGFGCAACGREHVLIRDVRGHRTQELLVVADGSLISWTAVNMHDDTFERVRQFQFRQAAPGKAILRIVPADDFTPADRKRIEQSLARKLDGQIAFDIELCDEIALTARGKCTYVDQKLDLVSLRATPAPPTTPAEVTTT